MNKPMKPSETNQSKDKIYKHITAVVRIIDPKTEKVETKHTKAIDSHERRAWLTSTVMWCLMNGKICEIVNKDDDKE